ncbi:MAG: 12,18-didecarboxysiroheme deacetylase [Candidatus Methanoperedens sp.]
MIGISKLYCGTVEPSDALRYGRDSSKLPSHLLQFSKDKKPVVVWNMGRRCNLKCVHCYAQSKDIEYKNELTTQQGKDLIDDLAQFGAPVILFSGGEPIMRKDLPELALYARSKGMRAVISTNGTLIDKKMAKVLKDIGLSYVGVSLDGMRETNDKFRGMKGAFDAALNGMRNCLAEGVKVGLRFTINKKNVKDIPAIFDLLEKEKIPRVCFYHLVYSGRGSKLVEQELSHEESRKTLDIIMDRTKALHDRGFPIEVLTVDNHCDGPYVYFRLLKEDPKRAAEVYELLQMNQGNSSGIGIGCVSWDGSVHPDQFWRHYSFGNVKERKFSELWTDTSNELMAGLKNRKPLIKANADRCAHCKWFDICNGNFRVRAEAIYGNVWADDPACYLTKEEIGYDEKK